MLSGPTMELKPRQSCGKLLASGVTWRSCWESPLELQVSLGLESLCPLIFTLRNVSYLLFHLLTRAFRSISAYDLGQLPYRCRYVLGAPSAPPEGPERAEAPL